MKASRVLLVGMLAMLIVAAGWFAFRFKLDFKSWLNGGEKRVETWVPRLTAEELNELVTMKVMVSHPLIGENNWYKGIWMVEGETLYTVDFSKMEQVNVKADQKSFTLKLPLPRVSFGRVNHERTRLVEFRSISWNPAQLVWGNPDELREAAMKQAQSKLTALANTDENVYRAKRKAESNLTTFCRGIGWDVMVSWLDE